ncbi:MAG TPA: lysophospholipid acyltransferase family protein [Candidatus Sulfomarinibacteraceae bacterium]|nr:lysophospholipid acyltransferase family protein [Candidatus Sulfomarinibacteraceae bacterium]
MSKPEPVEGLAFLRGRLPSARAGPLLRLLAAAGRFVGRYVAGLRWSVEGAEHLPNGGGYILACALHRNWIDAPLLVGIMPLEPRVWYIGSGPAAFRARWSEWLLRLIGGILPVYRGGTDVEVHVDAARAVLDGGAIFGIFPEGSRRGDPFAPEPFRRGVGLIGLRTGAPIVPVVLAGTAELYRGRRIAFRVLPRTSALELAGIETAPEPGTPGELVAAKAATAALQSLMAPHVLALARACDDPPSAPRRWRSLTNLVL